MLVVLSKLKQAIGVFWALGPGGRRSIFDHDAVHWYIDTRVIEAWLILAHFVCHITLCRLAS